MPTPIVLCNGTRYVKRLVLEADGGATLQHLTVAQEVTLSPSQLEAFLEFCTAYQVLPSTGVSDNDDLR